jgi:C4-dicarboxylate-specific signal transduction histidine kinase
LVWDPPVLATVAAGLSSGVTDREIDRLTGRYGTLIVLHGALVLLAAGVTVLGVRSSRRAARLLAESRHQARLRELERSLHHAERLAGVGRTAAAIAHEINNPLEGMSNHLALLEDDLRAGRTEASGAQLRRVREGLDRVASVTRQVLRLADPGRAPKRRLDLGDVLRETADFARDRAGGRSVAIRTRFEHGPLHVRGNATTLGQLFLNLLLNACEAQPDGGVVEASARARDGRIVVEVADRGPGIPPGAMDRLFEPFFSTKASTGLGLAVCRDIATDHGGTLSAANRPDGGALFTLDLPAAPEAEGGA